MTQQFTEEQKKFIEKAQAHRKERVEGLAYSALALALKSNLPVFDLPYYILQRSRQVIEEAFKLVDFNNPKLIKARKAFMKECLASMREKVAVKEPVEVKDETDERDNRCEPIAQELVKMLLSDDLVFSDTEYFDLILADEEKVPLSASIAGYENALDEKMTMIISEHWKRAGDNLWGVEKEKVTFQMLDDVLKRSVETPKA